MARIRQVKIGGMEETEFPGVFEEKVCGNSRGRKTHMEFPWPGSWFLNFEFPRYVTQFNFAEFRGEKACSLRNL